MLDDVSRVKSAILDMLIRVREIKNGNENGKMENSPNSVHTTTHNTCSVFSLCNLELIFWAFSLVLCNLREKTKCRCNKDPGVCGGWRKKQIHIFL